jgi:hypothetical protein
VAEHCCSARSPSVGPPPGCVTARGPFVAKQSPFPLRRGAPTTRDPARVEVLSVVLAYNLSLCHGSPSKTPTARWPPSSLESHAADGTPPRSRCLLPTSHRFPSSVRCGSLWKGTCPTLPGPFSVRNDKRFRRRDGETRSSPGLPSAAASPTFEKPTGMCVEVVERSSPPLPSLVARAETVLAAGRRRTKAV